MLEVNARAMAMMYDTGAMLGISADEIRAGFGFGDSVPSRFDWEVFARGCDWLLTRIGSPEAMEAAARDCFVKSTGTRAQVRLLRMFASPRALYWSLHRFGGHSLFANATTEVQSLSRTRLRFTVIMDGVPSTGFWVMCAGVIAAAPSAIGYPASVVRFESTGSRCDYTIEHTQSRSMVAKIHALLISLFSRGQVFDELEAQKNALNAQLKDLEAAHRRSEKALALRTRFLTMVTHELRTPLAGIIGLSDLIHAGHTPVGELPELTREISSSSHRLLQIVNDVMALEGEGLDNPDPTPVDLAPLLESLVAGYRIAAHARGLRVETNIEPGTPPAVTVDAGLALHALRCLMDNAVAFTDRGHISVHARVRSEMLEVDVEDTGCGIPIGLHNHIFEPFAQADESLARTHQGVGLGLAVARRLARGMGGDVTVRSAIGHGSTFTFRIPVHVLDVAVGTKPLAPPNRSIVATVPTPQPAAPPVAPARPILVGPQRSARALVVEDNLVNQKILQRLLVSLGLQVDVVENGLRAVEACTRETYDIIFMDLQMPVMDGFTATAEIRRLGDIPIFAVTANSEQQFRDRAIAAGMRGFVAKPISRDTVSEILVKVSIPPRPAGPPS